ncbi:helix-turn-helix domain-containing protein [Idiomarina sp. 29L]|uniref:helix-turn-helix domain-containing protein n=1 Tax=Idiomarina sp. 29L TaxID=2508877 RepID=UPI001011A141|nr:helix-turn-helix domain-containing protein [Idiomarina sp. 29L]RXS41507.1 helix-turn-helix domain-containing protein [Idiomarina sp. 29L]
MELAAPDFNLATQDLQGYIYSKRASQPAITLTCKDLESPIPGVVHGSGGKFTVTLAQSHSGAGISFVVQTGNSIAIAVEKICGTFGLTKEQLAEVLGTTRKTIYNWIEGVAPRSNTLVHIHELQMTANEWVKSGLPFPGEQLREPVIEELSLFDLIKKGEKDLILFAGNRLMLRGAKNKPLSDPFA